MEDLREIDLGLAQLGLEVKRKKYELTIQDRESLGDIHHFLDLFRTLMPLIGIVPASSSTLLEAPIHDDGIHSAANAKREDLRLMTEYLSLLDNHQAFARNKNYFLLP